MNSNHRIIAAVHLILERGGKTLLLRRYNTGYEDGNYSVVAGHIDGDESAYCAMVREANEEAGILIEKNCLEVVHVMHRKGSDNERIDFFIRAHEWEGEPSNMEKHKCDDLSWFKLDELPDNLVPYIEAAFGHIREGERYSEFGW